MQTRFMLLERKKDVKIDIMETISFRKCLTMSLRQMWQVQFRITRFEKLLFVKVLILFGILYVFPLRHV